MSARGRYQTIESVWRQHELPVVYRPEHGDLMIKIPYASTNKDWFRIGRRARPTYSPRYKCWLLPRSTFEEIVQRLLFRFRAAFVIQPFRAKEVCAPACWNAFGVTCECSCMGQNHGCNNSQGYYVVSETFAVKWGDAILSWKLLEVRA